MADSAYLPLFVALPIVLPWLGGLIVWLIGDARPRWQHLMASVATVFAGIAALFLIPIATEEPVFTLAMGSVFGNFTLVPDGLAIFLTVIATVVGSLAVIFSVAYMKGAAQLGRYYALVLLFIGTMSGLALSGSLLQLFIFWELTALCSYALISFHNDDPKAVAGGLKALVITQLGGVGMLVGVLALYPLLGDYQISTFMAQAGSLPQETLTLVAYGFLFAAMAKSAQVPLHTWLPDAMEAPTPISALIHAATMVNAGVYLLARFYPVFADVVGWQTAVTTIGLISALLAAVMALTATDLKRVLAYSTVSQLGYMVYAVGIGAVYASQFHLMSHALFKALLFLGAGAVIHSVGTRDMRKMGGLMSQMPFVGVVFLIGAAALAGIPILNGFWSKELVLEMGLENGPMWAYVGMLIGAGITALYSFRMVWMVFLDTSRSEPRKPIHPVSFEMKIALAPLAIGTLLTWLLAGSFGHWLEESLPFHHLHVETTGELIQAIVFNPATLIVLLVVAIGLAIWWWRDRFIGVQQRLTWLTRWAVSGFGFEWINGRVVFLTKNLGTHLQLTQTGQLSWNIIGIVLGVLFVALILIGGQ
ncbi:MAG: NADH-quinone oxidoreductase subunit L [Chloroflexi bacterium]|nr:NADH-quinone oxidoreductase subunit L [Chloroflexota bacterium]